jgi:hypothetical protein
MHTVKPISRSVRRKLWTGRILSGLVVAILVMDGVLKLIKAAPAVEATLQLGYPENTIFGMGALLLSCVALYMIPRTAVLGAILLTGYLGGAVATQVRLGSPLFSHVLFPVYLGLMIWIGLYLVNSRVRGLLPMSELP